MVASYCVFRKVPHLAAKKALPVSDALQRSFAGGLIQVLSDQQQHGIARPHSQALKSEGMLAAEVTSFAIHSLVLRQPCESLSVGFWLYGVADVHSASQGKSTQSGSGLLYCLLPGQSIELFEIRPQWDKPKIKQEYPFAKATFVRAKGRWKIYWKRADLKWHGGWTLSVRFQLIGYGRSHWGTGHRA